MSINEVLSRLQACMEKAINENQKYYNFHWAEISIPVKVKKDDLNESLYLNDFAMLVNGNSDQREILGYYFCASKEGEFNEEYAVKTTDKMLDKLISIPDGNRDRELFLRTRDISAQFYHVKDFGFDSNGELVFLIGDEMR